MGRQLLINFGRVLSTRNTVWWKSGIVEGATNHGPGWKDRRPIRHPRSRRMNSLLNTVVISFDWAHAARRRPDEDSTAPGSVPSAPTSTLRFSSSYFDSSMALQWLRTRSINWIPLLVYTSSSSGCWLRMQCQQSRAKKASHRRRSPIPVHTYVLVRRNLYVDLARKPGDLSVCLFEKRQERCFF